MTIAGALPTFDIRDIPFSHHGSWFGISPVIAEATYADDLHFVSHQNGLHAVLRFTPTDSSGSRVEASVAATPARLAWAWQDSVIELVYETDDTVRVRGDGKGLGLRVNAADPRLTPFSGPYFYRDPVDGSYIYTLYQTGRRYRITVLSGEPREVFGLQALGTAERGLDLTADQAWEIAVEEFDSARPRYRRGAAFDDVLKSVADRFSEFVDAIAPWRTVDTPAAELAVYVLWSATVRPAGFLSRPGVLMSKHWMDKVWSWDHCFNALALAQGDARLAWDQFLAPFDHQESTGALPDSVAHSEVLYNFVKPPIHGWTLERLWREVKHEIGTDELGRALVALEAWTEYWSRYRTAEASGLPQYQHGNDSGWDNATTFDDERVIESADLAAHLATQMHALAALHAECGHTETANGWDERAVALERRLLSELWVTDRFTARGVESGARRDSASLLDLMPIVLGRRLPADVRAGLVFRLRRHLTPYGLATERPDSPHYRSDGYWRGPIWAPVTVLIERALHESGETELAAEIARRFLRLCESHGFAENFDAMTGEGLRDKAYTWTASAYLLLAREHAHSFR